MNRLVPLIGLALVLAFSAVTFGQGGMGGGMGGMGGGYQPMEVVILLGEDYDFQEPPFVSAQEIVRAFGPDTSGLYMPGAPTLDTIRVDVESPVPQQRVRSIVAVHLASLAEGALEKFKNSTKLNALRFGINEVVFVAKESLDENAPRIWLREPYLGESSLTKESRTLFSISRALSDSLGDPPASSVRLDLFLPPRQPVTAGSGGMGMMDMGMEGMGMGDMGMDMDMGMDDMMSEYEQGAAMTPEERADNLKMKISDVDQQRAAFQKRMNALVSVLGEFSGELIENREHIKQQLAEVVRADLKLQHEQRSFEMQLLQLKIEKLQSRLNSQKRAINRLVDERVAELLQAP